MHLLENNSLNTEGVLKMISKGYTLFLLLRVVKQNGELALATDMSISILFKWHSCLYEYSNSITKKSHLVTHVHTPTQGHIDRKREIQSAILQYRFPNKPVLIH